MAALAQDLAQAKRWPILCTGSLFKTIKKKALRGSWRNGSAPVSSDAREVGG